MEMAFVFVSVFMVLIILFAGVYLLIERSSARGSVSERPRSMPPSLSMDFIPTQVYVDSASGNGVAVNEATKQVGFLKPGTKLLQTVACTDLIASFLVKNGNVIGRAIRSYPPTLAQCTQVEGLAGGSSSSTSDGHFPVQKIELVTVINDAEQPVHRVPFLDMDVKEGGVLYEQAMRNAKHWHLLIGNLIRQADCHSQAMNSSEEDETHRRAVAAGASVQHGAS